MQILSKNFIVPQNAKNINNTQISSPISQTPTFKASKTKVIEGITKELTNEIKLEGTKVKDILKDPKKRTLFFELLGAAIVSTVSTIVNIMEPTTSSDDSKKSIGKTNQKVSNKKTNTASNNSEVIGASQAQEVDTIKFDATKGIAPKIEKDFINFVNENFADNQIISDRLKLLFNEFGAFNRKDGHILNNNVVANKEILSLILEELKQAEKDQEKINEIINKYQGLLKVESPQIPNKKAPKKIEIEVSPDIKSVLDRYATLKTKYYEIINASNTKKEAEQKLRPIDNMIITLSYSNPSDEKAKRCLKALNKHYCDYIEPMAEIFEETPEEKIDNLCFIIADKKIAPKALENWSQEKDALKCDFPLYNELVRNGLDQQAIQKVCNMHYNRIFNNIEINSDDSEIKLTASNKTSITKAFENINKIFELVMNQKVTLRAEEDIIFNEEQLKDELKKDFLIDGKSTYPNIVSYLYGSHFNIYNEKSFDNNNKKYDYKFKVLSDALNESVLFNPKIFSPHCKMRFLERFVLNENFSPKTLKGAVREKTGQFIEAFRSSQIDGMVLTPYTTSNGRVGTKISIQTGSLGIVTITIDDQNKIHTIF